MGKDLTNSSIERQNVLNNPYAVQEIQKAVDIQCIPFEDRMRLTKEPVASFFEVTPRTIDNYIHKYEEELRFKGYEVIHGNHLKKFRITVQDQYVSETDFVNIKVPKLGIFDFRAFLNIATGKSRKRSVVTTFLTPVMQFQVLSRNGGAELRKTG